jgi:hypothetical protein
MARTIRKPDMFCEQCDRPISAQKNKHGLRNASSWVIAYGAWMKVEDWHCPICGGPAITVEERLTRLQFGDRTPSLVERIKGPASMAQPGDHAVVIEQLPRAEKGPTAWGNFKAVSALSSALGLSQKELQGELETLPYLAEGLSEPRAKGIVMQFVRLGGKAVVRAPDDRRPDERTGSVGHPGLSDPSPLVRIEELGRLRDAGLLTNDEFESKKAELLSRL